MQSPFLPLIPVILPGRFWVSPVPLTRPLSQFFCVGGVVSPVFLPDVSGCFSGLFTRLCQAIPISGVLVAVTPAGFTTKITGLLLLPIGGELTNKWVICCGPEYLSAGMACSKQYQPVCCFSSDTQSRFIPFSTHETYLTDTPIMIETVAFDIPKAKSFLIFSSNFLDDSSC